MEASHRCIGLNKTTCTQSGYISLDWFVIRNLADNMDTENHNDSSNQRDIRNNTVEAMDTEEGNLMKSNFVYWRKRADVPINFNENKIKYELVFMCPNCCHCHDERNHSNYRWFSIICRLIWTIPKYYVACHEFSALRCEKIQSIAWWKFFMMNRTLNVHVQ